MKKTRTLIFTVIIVVLGLVMCSKSNENEIFTDPRDGHEYKTVKIGNQIWMAENMAYKIGKSCLIYNDKQSNLKKYGYLYSWDIAMKVAPTGWHLPSKEEYLTLLNYYKQDTTKRTQALLVGGETGFNALLGGSYNDDNHFFLENKGTEFWTSTTYDRCASTFTLPDEPYFNEMAYIIGDAHYVRLIKDDETLKK